jgi:polysaccharide biosynthesis protein PslG
MKVGKRSWNVVVLVTTFGLCATSAAKADAAALPAEFFGVTPQIEIPTPAEIRLMSQSGVDTMRLPTGWGAIEPHPGERRWVDYDALIGEVAKAGMTVSPLLFGVPGWISPRPARPPIYTGAQRSAWATFLRDIAARYGNGGAFWRLHPELPYRPITHWEVWNEPNLKGFWDGKPNPRAYLNLLKLSRGGLRSGDPAALIVLGGLFPNPRRRFGVSQSSFLTRLYRLPAARSAFDALAIHPFSARPPGVLDACLELRRLMGKHHDRRTPIWITELGWPTSGKEIGISSYKASEPAQARRLTRSFRLLIKSRRRLRLERIIWFSWRDIGGPELPWTLKMGLLRSDGSAKPSLSAYSNVARG